MSGSGNRFDESSKTIYKLPITYYKRPYYNSILLKKCILPFLLEVADVVEAVEVGGSDIEVRRFGSDLIPSVPSYVAHRITDVALSKSLVQ